MREMQDDFALVMSDLGLERGKKGSNAKHEHIQKYYTRDKGFEPLFKEQLFFTTQTAISPFPAFYPRC